MMTTSKYTPNATIQQARIDATNHADRDVRTAATEWVSAWEALDAAPVASCDRQGRDEWAARLAYSGALAAAE